MFGWNAQVVCKIGDDAYMTSVDFANLKVANDDCRPGRVARRQPLRNLVHEPTFTIAVNVEHDNLGAIFENDLGFECAVCHVRSRYGGNALEEAPRGRLF